MKYEIKENENSLDINIDNIKGKKEKLLQAFQQCQVGSCSCPTEEYKNLDSLEIEDNDGTIQLHLKAKQGQKFNAEEINQCLEYTAKCVEEDNI